MGAKSKANARSTTGGRSAAGVARQTPKHACARERDRSAERSHRLLGHRPMIERLRRQPCKATDEQVEKLLSEVKATG